MNREEDRLLSEKGLAFFGLVTASLSHEISNVVAIINELSGLMNDLLIGAERGRPLKHEKLKELSAKIDRQVRNGESIIKTLNRFAHSIDDPVKDIDLGKLLKEVAALAQRFALLKTVRLETEFPNEPIAVRNCPFSLQHAVFICIRLALTDAGENDVVTLLCDGGGTDARIVVTGAPPPDNEEVDSELVVLSALMEKIGGSVKADPLDDNRYAFELLIPASIPG